MIFVAIFAFVFGLSIGFIAGAGWRAMFSGPMVVSYTDEDDTEFSGTRTDIEDIEYDENLTLGENIAKRAGIFYSSPDHDLIMELRGKNTEFEAWATPTNEGTD